MRCSGFLVLGPLTRRAILLMALTGSSAWGNSVTIGDVPLTAVRKMPHADRLRLEGQWVGVQRIGRGRPVSSFQLWSGDTEGKLYLNEGEGALRRALSDFKSRLRESGFSSEMVSLAEEAHAERDHAIVPSSVVTSGHYKESFGRLGASEAWEEAMGGMGVGNRLSMRREPSGMTPGHTTLTNERFEANGRSTGHEVALQHLDFYGRGPLKAIGTRTIRFSTKDGRPVVRKLVREETLREGGGVDVVEYQLDSIDDGPEVRTEMGQSGAPAAKTQPSSRR
jgi:hypothetical protein